MKTYLLIMLLSSGEIVRAEVDAGYCIEYVNRMQTGQIARVDADFVVTAICAPRADVEKAFAKAETQ